jgi:TolA-binding protein
MKRTPVTTGGRSTRPPPPARLLTRRAGARVAAILAGAAVVAAMLLALAGCNLESGAFDLSRRAKNQWDKGEYEDAARGFAALTEIYPGSTLAEESFYFAASLYDEYLQNKPTAIRYYQQLLVKYPDGQYALDARESLARIYESDPDTLYRALQIYRQLVLSKELRDRHEAFQYKIAEINVAMGRTDQARFELRTFLQQYPKSDRRAQVFYLIGYTFYLEKRRPLALAVMEKTVKEFPGTPVAQQAQFFMADTQEELGHLPEALRLFQGLQGKYHDPAIVEKRIETLQARLRRGVR